MTKKENTVALIAKIFAVLTVFGSFYIAQLFEGLNLLVISVAIVEAFFIYCVGEVIQLLDDIKANTSK